MVGGEEGGDSRRRALVAAFEVQAVGVLSGLEREPVVVQHVADPADSLECFWGLAYGEGLLEGGSGVRPFAVAEGGPAGIDRRHTAEYESDRPGS